MSAKCRQDVGRVLAECGQILGRVWAECGHREDRPLDREKNLRIEMELDRRRREILPSVMLMVNLR